MKLPKNAVNRPVATAMAFMAILLFGLVSLYKLPLDIMPEMELPTLTVMTVYPGASAGEIEEQVTKPLEEMLAGTEGLKDISSTSKENVSFIALQFNWGEDIAEASNNARDLIELVKRDLPDDAESPVIYKVNSSMLPILVYGITADENYAGINDIIKDDIANPIKKEEGVGSVIYVGEPEREIKINVDPYKMDAYNLSIEQVSSILKAENINVPGGNIKVGANDYSVRVPAKFNEVNEIESIPLVNFEGRIIKLNDIASIEDSFKDKDEYARNKEGQGVALMIQKQTGENTLNVTTSVREKVEELEERLPEDVKIFEVMNTDELIVQSINNLTETLWWALLFVSIVVFLFLREWRNSLIVFITIPFSLIVAFIIMFTAEYTINIFSLMALVIAIGMVVDNAIVVLENIVQHIEKGARPKQASIFGSGEMSMAITASTATTLMVFIPMIFVGGVVGLLFKQLAILTSVTMIASLITSLSLTPAAASKLLRGIREKDRKFSKSKFYHWSERIFKRIEKFYKGTLQWALRHKVFTLVTALLVFVITMFFGKRLGTDYIPEFDAGDIAIVIETEVGSTAKETDKAAQKVMKIIREEVPELEPGTLSSISGQTEDGILSSVGFDEGKNVSTIMAHLVLPSERERSAKEIGEALREKIEDIPEIESFHITAGSIVSEAITGNVKPIEVEITGNEYDELNQTARELFNRINDKEGFTDQATTIDEGKIEVQIIIDRDKATALALNTAMIGKQVRNSIYGAEAGELTQGGNEYEINMRYEPQFRDKIEALEDLKVTNLKGEQVALSSFAEIQEEIGAQQINRSEQQRIVKVTSNLDDISLGRGVNIVQNEIQQMNIPEGVNVNVAGQFTEQEESFEDLYLILVIGILLVYMVMAAQFESFKDPFIIMFAIPFTFVGIIWAFFATGLTLSVTTFIGVIMLMGIVVNNGIVLVDYIKLQRKRGLSLYDAVLEGGRSRMRPVLMTSFTTMLGMLPMALSQGMGKEMYSPLGVTIIGGLLVSMVVTLIIVPTIYTVFHMKETRKSEK
ncbi:MAG: efflux RND transporter permease subunit [Bacteroidales bacterium]